jgi:hypothetical protein
MVQGLISIDDIHAIGFCDSDSDFLFQSCEAGIDGDRSIQTSHVGGLLPFALQLNKYPND